MIKSEVFNSDCLPAMREYKKNYFDLAIVDPQYGIGESKKTQSRPLMAKQKNGSKLFVSSARKHKVKDWDLERPTREYFDELRRISKNQIIFGGNHFADLLPPSSGWIVWDKVNPESDQSDCELAWTSFKCGVRQIEFMWNGMIQGKSFREGLTAQGDKSKNEVRIHPTQKPIEIYKWIYCDYLKVMPFNVFDSHLGGGGHRIVAAAMGVEFTGYELDKDYFDASVKRFEQYKSQLKLFV